MTPSQVRRVTVHPNGALVVRVAQAQPGQVRVDGLPLSYAADTLRVRPASGSVHGLRACCALVGAPDAVDTAPGTEQRRALERERDALNARLTALDARVKIWRDFRPGEPPKAAGLPDPGGLLAINALSAERLAALSTTRAALLAERAAVERQLADAEYTPTDPEPPRFTRGVTFTLDASAPTVAVEIEYFVPAARWVPVYRIDLDAGRARLRTDALVAQATGESWHEAAISLATAYLARATTLPELTAWRIGTAQPQRRPAFRPPPEGLDPLFNGYDRARPGPPPPSVRPPEPPDFEAFGGAVAGAAAYEPTADAYDLMDEVDEVVEVARLAVAPAPAAAPPSPGRPMPKRSRMAAPEMMKRRSGPGGGGPSGQQATIRPPDDEAVRLRHAYLRLAGPDEAGRGRLHPVDPVTHLWTLLGDHPVVSAHALRRAVAALEDEAHRLARSPLPPGTCALGDESWHFVHAAHGLHTVPADGEWHRVAVRADEAPANLAWRAVPRGSTDVHRVCRVETPAGVPYPTGPLQVYIDGQYRVSATLDGAPGGPALTLDLGVDPQVRVVERTARVAQEDKGLVTQSTRVDHTVITRIRSAHAHPVTVEIYDRLPVTDDDEKQLTVTPLDSEPAPEMIHRDPDDAPLRGGLRWRVTVPPGEVRALTWRYRLEFPTKYEVVGGNRRE